MDSAEIIVVVSGLLLIAFVLWYFFGERKAVAASTTESGVQEIKVTVKGGVLARCYRRQAGKAGTP